MSVILALQRDVRDEFLPTFGLFFVFGFYAVPVLLVGLGRWVWPESHEEHVAHCALCLPRHLHESGRLEVRSNRAVGWAPPMWRQHAESCSICQGDRGRPEPEEYRAARLEEAQRIEVGS